MLKAKYWFAAVMVVCFTTSAMGSNFRAADQVYVPVAGKVAGASGTFISDVWVQNLSKDDVPVTVSVIFTPTGSSGTPTYFNNLFTLQPDERREFVDFISSPQPNGLGLAAGFGTLIFNACRQGQDCVNTQDPVSGESPHYRDIAVFSRIYSIPPGTTLAQNPPTTGQALPGVPWYHFVSSVQQPINLHQVTITGIRQTGSAGQAGTYRSNFGVMNASQYSTTTIKATLYNGQTRQPIGAPWTVRLGPLQHTQQNIATMFPDFGQGAASTNAYLIVEQEQNVPTNDAPSGCLNTAGCPGFIAYGSVLDNASGDATTLEPVYLEALTQAAQNAIYIPSAGRPAPRRAVRR